MQITSNFSNQMNSLRDLEQNLVLLQLSKAWQTVLHIFTEYPLTLWIIIMKLKICIDTISFCNNIAMDYGYFACLNCL